MDAHESNDVTSTWWRWPLVPIASIFGGLLGSFILIAIQWFGMKFQGGYTEDGWAYQYVMPFMGACVFGGIYAWVAYEVAPKGKLIAGTVMVTILTFSSLVGGLFIWTNHSYTIGQQISMTINTAAMIVTSIAGLMHAHSG